MKTPYDVVTLAIFAGLIVLFLQRSTSSEADDDAPLWQYLGAGAGCGAANYFGAGSLRDDEGDPRRHTVSRSTNNVRRWAGDM